MFKNLRELSIAMQNEADCRKFLAEQRWPDGKAICPYCGYGKCYNIENGKRYKCGSKECYKKFSVTVGTIFDDSNVPLTKWFVAIYIATAHKKGVSSHQLARDIGVSQKTAWFMLHRVREMMRPKEEMKLDNIVEVDEVYIGGKTKNISNRRRKEMREENRSSNHKSVVVGMIERGGNLKLIPAGSERAMGLHTVQPVVKEHVDRDAVLITDNSALYGGMKNEFAGHESVNHSGYEYVRDGVIHTNTIEGAFSHFRRSLYGIYHQITVKHLSRYCDETSFRYNLRKMKDSDRFTFSLGKVEGTLPYKKLIASNLPKVELSMAEPQMIIGGYPNVQGRKRPVCQIKDGVIIAQYPSIAAAADVNKIDPAKISRAAKGGRKTAGGFQWKFI